MDTRRRSNLVTGAMLLVLGVVFLAVQLFPGLSQFFRLDLSWPFIVIAVGLFLLVLGLLVGAPGMAVPACIVGGIGGLLYYQNATGNWESWAYAWSLIPGFVGLGIIVSGLLEGKGKQAFRAGSSLLFISLVLFLVFGSFFGALGMLGAYWPVLLIALGLIVLVRALMR